MSDRDDRPKLSPYQERIADILAQLGRHQVAPWHVEGYIRLVHPTLDGLSPEALVEEVRLALGAVDTARPGDPEKIAKSLGVAPRLPARKRTSRPTLH